MLNDINFIEWLALKAFIVNKVSNTTKIFSLLISALSVI